MCRGTVKMMEKGIRKRKRLVRLDVVDEDELMAYSTAPVK